MSAAALNIFHHPGRAIMALLRIASLVFDTLRKRRLPRGGGFGRRRRQLQGGLEHANSAERH